jgi:hypothetical protein
MAPKSISSSSTFGPHAFFPPDFSLKVSAAPSLEGRLADYLRQVQEASNAYKQQIDAFGAEHAVQATQHTITPSQTPPPLTPSQKSLIRRILKPKPTPSPSAVSAPVVGSKSVAHHSKSIEKTKAEPSRPVKKFSMPQVSDTRTFTSSVTVCAPPNS